MYHCVTILQLLKRQGHIQRDKPWDERRTHNRQPWRVGHILNVTIMYHWSNPNGIQQCFIGTRQINRLTSLMMMTSSVLTSGLIIQETPEFLALHSRPYNGNINSLLVLMWLHCTYVRSWIRTCILAYIFETFVFSKQVFQWRNTRGASFG